MRSWLFFSALILGLGLMAEDRPRIPHNRVEGRFRVEPPASVVDEVRRLVWSRCSYGQEYNGITCAGRPRPLSFPKASAHCAAHAKKPGQVWRLPTLTELESIADPNRVEGAKIDPIWFPATDPYGYWSKSFFTDTSGSAWSVYDFGAASHFGARTGEYLVRCVTEWYGP